MLQQDFDAHQNQDQSAGNFSFGFEFGAEQVPDFYAQHGEKKATMPIQAAAGRIGVFKKAKPTPTARASILVATASAVMLRTERSAPVPAASHSEHPAQPFTASLSILTPITDNSPKAIQWSTLRMALLNCTPTKYPTRGMAGLEQAEIQAHQYHLPGRGPAHTQAFAYGYGKGIHCKAQCD